jgi:hypothetical protein
MSLVPRALLGIAAMTVFAAPPAFAGTPFGSDDQGFFAPNKTTGTCENDLNKNDAKLWGAELKCDSSQATAAVSGKTFDMQKCIYSAIHSWGGASGQLTCQCARSAWLGALYFSVGALAQDSATFIFCDPAPNATVLGCETGLSTCLAKLVKNYVKCHASAQGAFSKGRAFDEEACEQGPGKSALAAYNTCVQKVTLKGGCSGCEDMTGAASFTDTALDTVLNGSVYCESPSGAFVE